TVDLSLQVVIGAFKINQPAACRADERDIAVEMAHIEHGDAEIVAAIFQLDIIGQRLLGNAPDLIVNGQSDQPGGGDDDQQAAQGRAFEPGRVRSPLSEHDLSAFTTHNLTVGRLSSTNVALDRTSVV